MGSDEAFKRLTAIRPDLELGIVQSASEEDARMKLINRMLTEVLGWDFSRIRTEPNTKSGFVDYVLSDETDRHVCVIEAKKISVLRLDTAATSLMKVNVGGTVLKTADDGIQQAIGYCARVGSLYAVLTDGASWVFFRALRNDGLPPQEGKAFVFPTLEAVVEEFSTFYELLAPECLRDQLHVARLNLLEGNHVRLAEPRYFVLNPADARLKARSDISRDVLDLFNRFFAAMSSEKDRDMRRLCFVETKESAEADVTLAKTAQHLTNTIQTLETEHGTQLQQHLQSVVASKISEICLIIGNNGAGKSTFLQRFFEDVLTPSIKAACVVAKIDVSDYEGGEAGVQRWLDEKLRDIYEAELFKERTATYDDFQGMFFSTYQRWSGATYKWLYDSDKTAFKIKFGEHVETRREQQPHEYAVGLLSHTVAGRGRLPCIVFDNTDHHSAALQDAIFQYAVALKNTCVCFVLLTAGDKVIWRLSKTTPIQQHFSRTFYLPTPPAKEILSKRVAYIRAKLEDDEKVSGAYFSDKGLKISIKNLGAFASIIEEALINDDAVAGLLGRLSNFDTTQMLKLARRIIASPTLGVEDLLRSYFTPKGLAAVDSKRAMEALIVGDHDRHNPQGNEFVMNLFWTDGNYPYSPLLACSILQFLLDLQVSASTDIDLAHSTVSNLINYFEPCGVARDETRYCLKLLFELKLIAPMDSNINALTDGSKVTLAPRGAAHLELATRNDMYVMQMAFVTGYRYAENRDEIARFHNARNGDNTRASFVRFLLADDPLKMRVPNVDGYAMLTKLRNELSAYWRVNPVQRPIRR